MALVDPVDLEIMKVLWEHGALKPSEIQEGLGRRIKNSALRWRLGALMEKGQVKRRRKGKAYYYEAMAAKESVFRQLTRRMADVFCGGSAMALIGQMIGSEEELSEEDILELRRIAERKARSLKGSREKG